MEAARDAGREVLSRCVFCDIGSERIVQQTDLLMAIRDLFPVTALHTLIIPKRHISSYFELTNEELDQLHDLLKADVCDSLEKTEGKDTVTLLHVINGEDACVSSATNRRKGIALNYLILCEDHQLLLPQ